MSFHKSCFGQSWETKAIKHTKEFRKAVDNHGFKVGDSPKEIYDKLDKLESQIATIYQKWPMINNDEELEEWIGDIQEDLDTFGQYISDYRNPDELENPNDARPENDPLNNADIGRWENNHWPDIQDRTDWIIEKLK